MRQTAETSVQTWNPCSDRPLHERIAEAVQSRATPISQLLRLMSALDAEGNANENLRLQLRARIGAPLSA
ncbi:hypothetical protein MKK70_13330 [Methylobacterium sp. E-041]|jgi:hypothetical protein|uniref:hypothetical protein n=1 Tax=unclassified Methylobacterium TaxID=2615210 RepID=UPI0011C8186A|nr:MULTISPECIES: hypothetical protein [unclassified Methylobacterium]MCJ2008189.1 hypothetical protein [Methylobacterium sp. J-092]MCJ2038156.1 hypothetical protein [Methylobacterium sp. J-059]MCJ2078424.1 hypothetical protein [Methylobacterium sp. E-016]MCJ2106346.1 hypothetical protein [Methylobacterium sp. E-041]MCJ2112464.1 hypothetical protein [Methylobacterium sp. E-025]